MSTFVLFFLSILALSYCISLFYFCGCFELTFDWLIKAFQCNDRGKDPPAPSVLLWIDNPEVSQCL